MAPADHERPWPVPEPAAGDAVVAEGQVNVPEAALVGGGNVGLGTIHRDDGWSGCPRPQARIEPPQMTVIRSISAFRPRDGGSGAGGSDF